MLTSPSIFGLLSLLLGLFCWSDAANVRPKKPVDQIPPTLALRQVHDQTKKLAPQVAEDPKKCPAGYRLMWQKGWENEDGGFEPDSPIIVSEKAIITDRDVANAKLSEQQAGTILVRLSEAGGKALNEATKKMAFGKSRLAMIVEGKCLVAPSIQAALGHEFTITGLDEDAPQVVQALNNKDR